MDIVFLGFFFFVSACTNQLSSHFGNQFSRKQAQSFWANRRFPPNTHKHTEMPSRPPAFVAC